MANENKIINKKRTFLHVKTAKIKSLLEKKLKVALENYSNNPDCLEELDQISSKLTSLDFKKKIVNHEGIDRFQKYISESQDNLQNNLFINSDHPSFQEFNPQTHLQNHIQKDINLDHFQLNLNNKQSDDFEFSNSLPDQIENKKTRRNSKNKLIKNETKPKSSHSKDIEPVEDDSKGQKEKMIPEFIKFEENVDIEDQEQVVEDRIEEIKEALRKNSVLLVQGNTGCGKTTKIPRFLMNEYPNIVCTQPRRLAAINVATKVASDLGCTVGSTIGYSVRFEDVTSEQTKLRFVTDGVLVNEIASKKFNKNEKIGRYDLIIIDEAHERSINIDYLLGYFKKRLKEESITTKLLIMSATINSEKSAEFFSCPVISIKHKIFPLDYFYLKEDIEEYLEVCISTVFKIIQSDENGDILVFLTGQDEIERAYQIISFKLSQTKISVLKLYSTMPPEEQDLVFKIKTRKIVLSTNIAETSITIENVKYVVDCGKFKCKSHSNSSPIHYLEIIDISKAQANQRAGRAGRTQPGIVYRIYSHEKYLSLEANPQPEVLRTKLSSIVLAMKSLGIHNVYDFDYIDKPSEDFLRSAEETLYYLRAIDSNGLVTRLGSRIAKLPMVPEMALTLHIANKLGCLNSVATIAAFLEYQTPFLEIRNDNPNYGKYKSVIKYYSHPKGEFYSFLEIFRDWRKSNFSIEFLKRNFLSINSMIQIKKIRTQVLSFFSETTDTCFSIEEAFCTGFFMNVAKIEKEGYRTVFGDIKCFIHPKDGLYRRDSKLIVFIDLQSSKKKYMRHCLEVDSYTLQTCSNFILDIKK